MRGANHPVNRMRVNFDDGHTVADAGLVLPATLAAHLGLEAAADELVDVGYRPGRKTLTLVHALSAGADCIDDADVLRAGSTGRVLGHGVMAPSTLGTWLRSFTFGHVRRLDRLTETLLTRARAAGPDPARRYWCRHRLDRGGGPRLRQAGRRLRLHPPAGLPPAAGTRADTGEVVHIRMRRGSANTARGAQRFVRETIARARRAGATGPMVLRADSGLWSNKTIKACRDHRARFSITVRQTRPVRDTIDAVAEQE